VTAFVERLIVPLALLTGVLGLVYWYWTTTPSYAISQVAQAVFNHDTDAFEKYVDIDNIVSHAFDDVIHGPARSEIFGHQGGMIGVGIISFFKPEIVNIAHDEIVGFVQHQNWKHATETTTQSGEPRQGNWPKGASGVAAGLAAGVASLTASHSSDSSSSTGSVSQTDPGNGGAMPETQGGSPSATAVMTAPAVEEKAEGDDAFRRLGKRGAKVSEQLKAYGLSREGFKGVDYVTTEGPVSHFGLKFHSPKLNRDFTIEFKMEDVGGYWRITELSNLNELVDLYLSSKEPSDKS
jgi:hypothetical protein